MFTRLRDEIKNLNADLNNVANCEKAKRLRKKLLTIGLTMAIIGGIGLFTCFVLFVTAGRESFTQNGFSARVLVPYILFMPFALLSAIGTNIAHLGFSIVITGYTTNLVNETIGNNCPKCGDAIDADEIYCNKCGEKVKKVCADCQTINSVKDEFCRKCGNKL